MDNCRFASCRILLLMGLLSMLVPASVFYILLQKARLDLPIADDYDSVLHFTNVLATRDNFSSRLLHILTFQHAEYKLIFENTVFALQYFALGHVSFHPLIFLGNAFIVLLYCLLVFIQKSRAQSALDAFLLLLPIAFLLFQLQYVTTLNWAMGSLQNLPVLFFSLLSIALLSLISRASFVGACVAMLLAVASSGNGFLVVPVGVLLLLQLKRWQRIFAWIVTSSAAASLYFCRYNFASSQSAKGRSVVQSLAHLNPVYALSFLGSSMAGSRSYLPSVCFGIVLCLLLALAVRLRYYEVNPSVFYSMVFLVITAVIVSGLRSDLGVLQSLASRYRINSNLFLILIYMFLAETFFGKTRIGVLGKRYAVIATIVICCAFCALSDRAGYHLLTGRRQAVRLEMARFQHSVASPSNPCFADAVLLRQIDAGTYKPDAAVLMESERLGIYFPESVSGNDFSGACK